MAFPDIVPLCVPGLFVKKNMKTREHPHCCSPTKNSHIRRKRKSCSLRCSCLAFLISSRVWDQPLSLQREQCHSDTLMWQQKPVCLGQASLPSGYRHGGCDIRSDVVVKPVSRLTAVLIASLQKAEK